MTPDLFIDDDDIQALVDETAQYLYERDCVTYEATTGESLEGRADLLEQMSDDARRKAEAIAAFCRLEADLLDWHDAHPEEPVSAFPLYDRLLMAQRGLMSVKEDKR